MKQSVFFFLFLVITRAIYAQTVEIIDVKQVNENIILIFNLQPQKDIREKYDLIITSSKDDYKAPLIIPDSIVKSVSPQDSFRCVINGSENFAGYYGVLAVQIEAILVYSPLRFISPNEQIFIKKGKTMDLLWEGGERDETKFNLELYRYDVKIGTIKSNISKKSAIWDIPSHTKPGKDYSIRVEIDGDIQQAAFTKKFFVKRKISIAVTVLPFVLAGGIFAIIRNTKIQKAKAQEKSSARNNQLPAPPNLPD